MIKEAIEKIQELVRAGKDFEFQEIHGNIHYIDGGVPRRIYKPEESPPKTMSFFTLSGLADFVENQGMKDVHIHIESPLYVTVVSDMFPSLDNSRWKMAEAKAASCSFVFGDTRPNSHSNPWYALVDFVIALQSQFVQTEQVDQVISMLSNLHNEKITENKDDGFSQSLQVRTGLTTKSKVEVKNPVILRPFRTFPETDQPEGKFILRFREYEKQIQCALYAADGGRWEIEAIQTIKKFMCDKVGVPVFA